MGSEVKMVSYATRNFRADLKARLKLLALVFDETLEMMVNRAVERGLVELEREAEELRGMREGGGDV